MKPLPSVLMLTAIAAPALFAERAGPPNVIVIVSDDQGYADAGFQGSRDIRTPHLDSLARSGAVCTAGYVTFPVCSPSRAGLLSGRHGARFGYDTNPDWPTENPHARGLPLSERTMAEAMKEAGYVTGAIGKWHLGTEPHFHPNRRGFDEFFGFLGGGHDYWNWKPGNSEYHAPMQRNGKVVRGMETRYLTDVFSDEAISFITRHKDERFFLYLAYNAPHAPLQASPAYLARVPDLTGKRQIYAAMIAAMDDGIGRVRSELEKWQLAQDTLIVFFSDNGGPTYQNASLNTPLRGGKSEVWEGGIRVPYVVAWPGHIPAGTRYNRPVSTLDVLPTALAAAGVDLADSPSHEGVDLLPALTGATTESPHKRLCWRHRNGSWAIREGAWKLLQAPEGKRLLFNLESDAAEANDLAAREPGRVARLLQAYREWNAANAGRIPWFPSPAHR